FLLKAQGELVHVLPLQQLVAAVELKPNLAGDFTGTLADAGRYFVHPVAEEPLVGERLRDGDVRADDAVRRDVGRADLTDRVQEDLRAVGGNGFVVRDRQTGREHRLDPERVAGL